MGRLNWLICTSGSHPTASAARRVPSLSQIGEPKERLTFSKDLKDQGVTAVHRIIMRRDDNTYQTYPDIQPLIAPRLLKCRLHAMFHSSLHTSMPYSRPLTSALFTAWNETNQNQFYVFICPCAVHAISFCWLSVHLGDSRRVYL